MRERDFGRNRPGDSVRSELVDVMFRRHYEAPLRLAVVMVGDLSFLGGSVKTHAHRGLQALQQRIEVTR
jgi:hypothetical protein